MSSCCSHNGKHKVIIVQKSAWVKLHTDFMTCQSSTVHNSTINIANLEVIKSGFKLWIFEQVRILMTPLIRDIKRNITLIYIIHLLTVSSADITSKIICNAYYQPSKCAQ